MELARSLIVPRALGGRPTGRAPLRIVHQALAGEERLFAGREGELLPAIATGQSAILVHALQTLLRWDAVTARRAVRAERRSGALGRRGDCAPGPVRAEPGSSREDTRDVKGFWRISQVRFRNRTEGIAVGRACRTNHAVWRPLPSRPSCWSMSSRVVAAVLLPPHRAQPRPLRRRRAQAASRVRPQSVGWITRRARRTCSFDTTREAD